ncbi:SDR family NAD(P)-dependent oxidoreductase [Candidatus Daviesbacteria bacterium]|nr:SDR family NAD(P)-dependent oxidoreductase [Candidatus Daviesbacteria bacterium]
MQERESGTALVIGGTSGLGLELATLLHSKNNFGVYVTGREKPENEQIKFIHLNIGPDTNLLPSRINNIISDLPQTDLLVYAAGFYQEGSMKQLTDEDITKMVNVGLVAPMLILNRILNRQNKLPGVMAITSTSQWTPRIDEPIYTAVKAGFGMFANSLSLDPQVGKVLVAGPAGMKTNFWLETEKDTSNMLEPAWVAKQIYQLYFEDNFKYKCVRILREPPRIEILENRIA